MYNNLYGLKIYFSFLFCFKPCMYVYILNILRRALNKFLKLTSSFSNQWHSVRYISKIKEI